MRDLVIGDLHFGVKTNNISWLESQLNFIRTQIFDTIDNENVDRIVFLGDLFDIRYSTNQQVGIEVKKVIRELANRFSGDIIFIAGNHDYYSPLEEFTEYNSYELVFGEEFCNVHTNVIFVTKDPILKDGALFLPWYYTENTNHFDDLLYNYDMGREVKCIYCHADVSVWPGARIASLRGAPVYSGHIHYPYTDIIGNLFNLGAALPLTFGDVNDDRHLYIIEDYKIVKKIKNVTTPSFKRFYNEAIFDLKAEDFNNSYLQLCISNSNINKAQYIEQIKEIKSTYLSSSIRVNVIDDNETPEDFDTAQGFNTNITQYIENNIPKHLNTKYEMIKEKIKIENSLS